VVVGFEKGHPEVKPGTRFHMLVKSAGDGDIFTRGHPTTAVEPSLYKEGEIVIYKKRYSAFAGSALDTILRCQGIENLVLFGISTGGVTLSTVRDAFDLDYQVVVVKDACADHSQEVHDVLVNQIFPATASVASAAEVEALF
jgi:nicotinamidase-related amidase